MAEILLKGTDLEDWKNGDILTVRPDGFIWGKCECEPIFTTLRLKGVDPTEVEKYIGVWPTVDGSIYRPSMWRYDVKVAAFIRKSDGLTEAVKVPSANP